MSPPSDYIQDVFGPLLINMSQELLLENVGASLQNLIVKCFDLNSIAFRASRWILGEYVLFSVKT